MKLSVVMPVYNEIKTIKEIIDRIKATKLNKEIIIVEDPSSDGTREFLKTISDKNIKIIFNNSRTGKGAAIKTALNHVSGDITIIQDADLEYNPNDYGRLIKPILDGKADVVYGTRFPKGGSHPKITNPFFFWNRVLTFTTNSLYGTNITDEPTCYKAFRTSLLKSINLKCKRFEFCPEVTAKVSKRGYKIHEVPISYEPRSIAEGKKVRWQDGIECLWALIKYRFAD